MDKPEFKLLPCIFCTIVFNSYVAVKKLASAAGNKLSPKTELLRNDQNEERENLAKNQSTKNI